MGGNSSDESDDSTHATEWNKKTVKDLKVARRAFQAAAFVSSGYAPNLEFQERLEELEKEESQKKRSKKKTSTTKTRKTTIETVEGVINEETVRIDHAAIRFATTINIRTGGNHYVPIKEDTGTDVNWITRGLVQQLALHILDAPAGMKFRDFNGNDFEAKHRVTLPLVGETNKSQHAECFIAPDGFPFDCVVVGSAFVNEAGPPHELFAEKPEGTAFVMIQTPVTEAEKLRIAAKEATADAKAAALARDREQRMNAIGGFKAPVRVAQAVSSASPNSGPSSISSSQKDQKDQMLAPGP